MKSLKKSLIKSIVFTSVISFALFGCKKKDSNSELTSIAITTNPTKTTYTVGEAFSLDGIVVTAYYGEESVEAVNYSSSIAEGYVFKDSDIGNKDVTITYIDKTASFTIEVKAETPGKTLVGIAINSDSVDKEYFVDETFSSAGLIVYALYDDESQEEVSDYTLSTPDMSTTGAKIVYVYYGDYQKYFVIQVLPLPVVKVTSIEVTTPPNKTTYYVGEPFDGEGMIVTAYYNNGTHQEVADYTLSNYETTFAGDKYVLITYEEDGTEVTTTQLIHINALTLTDIEITKDPDKVTYYQNEAIDLTGIIVVAKYDNETQHEVTNIAIDSGDTSVLGANIITISYTEGGVTKTDTFNITVNELPVEVTLSSIEISKPAINLEYILGETLDVSGLEVTAHYSDDSSSPVALSAVEVSGDLSSTGDKTVTVSYEYKSVTKTAEYTVKVLPQNHLYQIDYDLGSETVEVDTDEKTIRNIRPDTNEEFYLKYKDCSFGGGSLVTLAPNGYISMIYNENESQALGKIDSMAITSSNNGQDFAIYTGYIGRGSGEMPFNASDAYGYVVENSGGSYKLPGKVSYVAIVNSGSEPLALDFVSICYRSGKHASNPFEGSAPYYFVSGVTKYVDDTLLPLDSSPIFGDGVVLDEEHQQVKYTYRQGNMVWDHNGNVNEPRSFDISIDIYFFCDLLSCYTVTAYIKDGSTVTPVEVGALHEETGVLIGGDTFPLYTCHIELEDVTLWHAGGPFLFVEINIDGTGCTDEQLIVLPYVSIYTSGVAHP